MDKRRSYFWYAFLFCLILSASFLTKSKKVEAACIDYSPNYGVSTSTFSLSVGIGPTKSLFLAYQNPPTILQSLAFVAQNPNDPCLPQTSFRIERYLVGTSEEIWVGGYYQSSQYEKLKTPIWANPFSWQYYNPVCNAGSCYPAFIGNDRFLREDDLVNRVDLAERIFFRIKTKKRVSNGFVPDVVLDMSAPATNCQKISGNGPKKVVFMRPFNSNSSISNFLTKVSEFRDYMLTKKPYIDSPSQYSYYLDLKKQTSNTFNKTASAQVSSCGSDASEYRYMLQCVSTGYSFASQNLRTIYDKLPETVTGEIAIPWYLSSIAALNAKSIKDTITKVGLDGKSLKNAWEVASFQISNLNEITAKKVAQFITESVKNIGKKYDLSSEETQFLFSAMVSGDAPFTVESFTFDAGSTFRLGFGSKIVYKAKKDTSRPWPDCVVLNTETTQQVPNADTAPAPIVDNVTPATGFPPNTYSISGSELGTNGFNTIKLTPISPTSLVPSSIFTASVSSAFDAIKDFFKNLFSVTKVEAQTISSGAFYTVETLSGTQSSTIFTVPTTVPDGTYKVSVSRVGGEWTDTTYTITVAGNGSGDPATAVIDWSSVPIPAAVPVVTLTATGNTISWTSSDATYCDAGGAWTGSRATLGTVSVNPTTASTYTMTCTNLVGDSQPVSVSIVPTPILTSLNYPSAAAGSWILITGSGFSTSIANNIDRVQFSGAQTYEFTAGISAGMPGTFISPPTPNMPAGAYTAFKIDTSTAPGNYTVKVANQNGPWSNGLSFTVLPRQNSDGTYNFAYAVAMQSTPPIIISFSQPNTAGTTTPVLDIPISVLEVVTGQSVTIRGHDFSPTANRIELSSQSLEHPRSDTVSVVSRLAQSLTKIKNRIASVFGVADKVSVQPSDVYEIKNIQSADGASVTFTIPVGIPSKTYVLRVAAASSEWSRPISMRVFSRKVADVELGRSDQTTNPAQSPKLVASIDPTYPLSRDVIIGTDEVITTKIDLTAPTEDMFLESIGLQVTGTNIQAIKRLSIWNNTGLQKLGTATIDKMAGTSLVVLSRPFTVAKGSKSSFLVKADIVSSGIQSGDTVSVTLMDQGTGTTRVRDVDSGVDIQLDIDRASTPRVITLVSENILVNPKYIMITTPNASDPIYFGESKYIEWRSAGVQNVSVLACWSATGSNNDSCKVITKMPAGSAGGSYEWTPTTSFFGGPQGDVKIRIVSDDSDPILSTPPISDESNRTFSVQTKPLSTPGAFNAPLDTEQSSVKASTDGGRKDIEFQQF